MKKILIAVLLGTLALPISVRATAEQPQNVPATEKFELQSVIPLPCGKLRLFVHWATDTEVWSKRFMGNPEHPLILRHMLLSKNDTIEKDEIWLDRNEDGIFDEKYINFDELKEKYPSPCDAVL